MDKTLLQFMLQYALQTGADTKVVMDERFAAMLTEVNAKIATLSGADQNILAFLDKVKKLTDADPGTPEWEEGANLFSLITERYAAVTARVGVLENAQAQTAALVQVLSSDLVSLVQRVFAAEGEIRGLRSEAAFSRAGVEAITTQLADVGNSFSAIAGEFARGLRGLPSANGNTYVNVLAGAAPASGPSAGDGGVI